MAPGLQDLIPGLREAEDRYRQESAEAFAGVEPDIAGMIGISPFTPKMYVDLEGASCAFFRTGTEIRPEDIAVFLWRCSPHYQAGTEDARALRRLFNASLYVLPYDAAVTDIQLYIRRAWAQMPLWKRKAGSDRSIGEWPSRLVHMFASEYGWPEDYILNLPFRRLWQYANRVLESNDPDFKELCNESMRLRSEFLTRMTEDLQRQKAERESQGVRN